MRERRAQASPSAFGLALLLMIAGVAGAQQAEKRSPRGKPHPASRIERPSGTSPSIPRTSVGSSTPAVSSGPVVREAVRHDLSPPLLSIRPIPPTPGALREIPLRPLPKAQRGETSAEPKGSDPALQTFAPVTPAIPSTQVNFEGLKNVDNQNVLGFEVFPPDTNGDIGPNHYVQIVNLLLAVYNRSGTRIFGPVGINTLWAGFGGPCEDHNDGDPIALYDPLADRWLISQFAFFPGFHQCIAISQTSDPTGAWFRYDFFISETKLNDYPKFGVWPDAYYMSINQFFGFDGFAGAGVVAFERDKMLQGRPARMVYFDLFDVNPNFGGMLPADLDGLRPPPDGAPNYFVEVDDTIFGFPTDRLQFFQFHVDWSNPANSTFTGPEVINLTAAGFSFAPMLDGIPQPGAGLPLDPLGDRLMYRLAYRNFGDHESLVVNHVVDTGFSHAGVRWYEIRDPGGSPPTLFQGGTFAPDVNHRWMGSAAMDAAGDMALGYSVSSTGVFPSIRYTGRLVGDPAGTLPQGEATIIAGSGSQGGNRWGDYSMMAVDPVDDCTFWYTTEYYALSDLDINWQTRVASFKFPSCTAPLSGALQGTVRDANTNLPLANATVQVGAFSRLTDANGNYQVGPVLPGTYTVTASRFGYFPQTVNNIVVPAGGITAQDFSLTARPLVTVQGTVTDGSAHGWPLYARIEIPDLPASPIFTNPATGAYNVLVPQGEELLFKVSAVSPGYSSESRFVAAPMGGATENFVLLASFETCAARGYDVRYAHVTSAQPVYSQDFEVNNGGFAVSGTTSWQWGTPTSGPGSAHSGTKAWATNLSGNYNQFEDGFITSPDIDLSSFTGQTLLLTWFQWLQTVPFDYAVTQVSNDGGVTWRLVDNFFAEGDVDLSWTQHRVQLNPSDAVSNFRVRFFLGAEGFGGPAPGFYVDDVVISVVQIEDVETRLVERFETRLTPAGWSVVDNAGTGQVWLFDNPRGLSNVTLGFDNAGGGFAVVDSGLYFPNGQQDTELVSPSFDLTGLTNVRIEFNDDFPTQIQNGVGDVDLSINGGLTWTNVFHRNGDFHCGAFDGCNGFSIPRRQEIDISSLAAGQSDVKVRFHYANAFDEFGWQIDNVRVGEPSDVTLPCQTFSGGLLVGNVYDAGSNLPLNNAVVASDNVFTERTVTMATPDDPAVDDGFYTLFSSLAGLHPFTASRIAYSPQTQQVGVLADSVVVQNFMLSALNPAINSGGVVNSASFMPGSGLAPGSIAAVFGVNLSASTAVAGSLPLPVTLGGATMKFNTTQSVPKFFAAPSQVNIQIPWELQGQSSASLTDSIDGVTSAAENIPLATFSPGLYATNQQGTNQGAILIANTPNLVAPTGLFPGSRPAVRGVDFLEIYWTGGGPVTNQPATGAAASANPLSATTATPTVTIGGVPAAALFSGLAPNFVGLYVVTLLVPPNAPTGNAVPVVLTIGGVTSNTVTIAVE